MDKGLSVKTTENKRQKSLYHRLGGDKEGPRDVKQGNIESYEAES